MILILMILILMILILMMLMVPSPNQSTTDWKTNPLFLDCEGQLLCWKFQPLLEQNVVEHPLRPEPADVPPHPTEIIYYWSMLWCSMFCYCYHFDVTTLMFHVLLLLRCSMIASFAVPCFPALMLHPPNAILLCISSTLRGIQECLQMCEQFLSTMDWTR